MGSEKQFGWLRYRQDSGTVLGYVYLPMYTSWIAHRVAPYRNDSSDALRVYPGGFEDEVRAVKSPHAACLSLE